MTILKYRLQGVLLILSQTSKEKIKIRCEILIFNAHFHSIVCTYTSIKLKIRVGLFASIGHVTYFYQDNTNVFFGEVTIRSGKSVQKVTGMEMFRIISQRGDFYGSISTDKTSVSGTQLFSIQFFLFFWGGRGGTQILHLTRGFQVRVLAGSLVLDLVTINKVFLLSTT